MKTNEKLIEFFKTTELSPYNEGEAEQITAEVEKLCDPVSVKHYDENGVKFTSVEYVTTYGRDFDTAIFEYCWG